MSTIQSPIRAGSPFPRWSACCLALCLASAWLPVSAQSSDGVKLREASTRFLVEYCLDCHSTSDPGGERDFETLDLEHQHLDTQLLLQEIIDQLTLGAMPPEDADQPSTSERLAAIDQLTNVLGTMREQASSTGGQSVLRRLSRREYRNTIGDLLAIDMTMFDPTIEFPADNLTHNFDNFGDSLVTSGHLLEKYLDAADRCIEKAFAGLESPQSREWVFKEGFFQQQELSRAHKDAFNYRYMVLYDHPLNDKPEGAYGPLPKFDSGVPADGRYEVKVLAEALHRDTPYGDKAVFIDLDEPFRMGIRPGDTSIGDMVHTQPIQPKLAEEVIADDELQWYTFQVPLDQGFAPRFTFENGQQDVRGAYQRVFRHHRDTLPKYLHDASGIVDWRNGVVKHGYLPQIRIHEIRLRGPLDDPQQQRHRQEILLQGQEFNEADVTQLIERFAGRAYRRPATRQEVQGLVDLYEKRRADGRAPLDAYKDALKASLCSPAFLYLSPPDASEQTKLSEHGLAQRMSYFLTSSMPDDRLRKLADQGKLSHPEILRQEARRLLATEQSNTFIADFLDSWLNLRSLGSMPPDPKQAEVYYSAGLEPEMKQETQLFMRDLIDRNASVLEFLRANHSFVNRDLAKLYGVADQVPAEAAAEFHRVTFDDPRRGGLLGQASILTVSANGIDTSPVIRGIWLLENVLGSQVPPPPDAVPAFDPDVRGAVSIRDQLAKHRESAACNQCHRKFDPLGFALECFDPIGRSREYYGRDRKVKIDTSGVLVGGESFAGPAELRKLLLEREEFFVRTVTNRLLSHAMGRLIESVDRPSVDKIVAQVQKDDYPLEDLILAVVTSDLFQAR